jgi:hypothetical protein
MRSKNKSAVLAGLLIASFMLVGTACGGSSSNSGSSSDTSAKSETGAKSSGGNGGDASSCADLFNKTEALAAKMDALDTGDMSSDLSAMVRSLESFTSNVPSEIRDDWKTIVSAIKTYADAVSGIDFTNLTDPDTVSKLEKAASAMDDAKFEKASENLDQWSQKNCPSYANK